MKKNKQTNIVFTTTPLMIGEPIQLKNPARGAKTIEDLIPVLPTKKPKDYFFYSIVPGKTKTENGITTFTECTVAELLTKRDYLYNDYEIFSASTPDWLIIDQLNYLKALNDSDDYEPEVITSVCQDLVHNPIYSMKVRETAAKCLYTEEMDIEAMVDILGMEPDIRIAFISENISENFPDIILELLKYDENEYIRQLAKKSLENS